MKKEADKHAIETMRKKRLEEADMVEVRERKLDTLDYR